jgi:hypothetical protein
MGNKFLTFKNIFNKLKDKILPRLRWEASDSRRMTSKELNQLKRLLNSFYSGYRLSEKERADLNETIKNVDFIIRNQRKSDKDIIKKRILLKSYAIRYKIYEFLGGD